MGGVKDSLRLATWCIGLPTGYVLAIPLGFGAAGVWASFAIGVGIAAALLLRRFWQKTAHVLI